MSGIHLSLVHYYEVEMAASAGRLFAAREDLDNFMRRWHGHEFMLNGFMRQDKEIEVKRARALFERDRSKFLRVKEGQSEVAIITDIRARRASIAKLMG